MWLHVPSCCRHGQIPRRSMLLTSGRAATKRLQAAVCADGHAQQPPPAPQRPPPTVQQPYAWGRRISERSALLRLLHSALPHSSPFLHCTACVRDLVSSADDRELQELICRS